MLELHILNSIPYVQIFYKNTTGTTDQADLLPMNIPNCGIICPLSKMFELYKDILPDSFEEECKLKRDKLLLLVQESNTTNHGILITGIVLLAFLGFALITLAIKSWCPKKSYMPAGKKGEP